jgi:hypothetical protein
MRGTERGTHPRSSTQSTRSLRFVGQRGICKRRRGGCDGDRPDSSHRRRTTTQTCSSCGLAGARGHVEQHKSKIRAVIEQQQAATRTAIERTRQQIQEELELRVEGRPPLNHPYPNKESVLDSRVLHNTSDSNGSISELPTCSWPALKPSYRNRASWHIPRPIVRVHHWNKPGEILR